MDGALSDGASALLGGRAPERKGYFYEPTLLDGVPAGAAILNTEIFGPVAPVVRFTDEADAIRSANATEFGLVCYVYKQDLRRCCCERGGLVAPIACVRAVSTDFRVAALGAFRLGHEDER